MVNPLRCPAIDETASGRRVVGGAAVAVLLCLWLAGPLPAQQPPVHYWHHGSMPPGAIGGVQLQRGGPLPGFFQPLQIQAPPGVVISPAEEGGFRAVHPSPVTLGLLIGQVYRFRVMNVPMNEGLEIFPTIEVIDRLYAPPGREPQFPIVVQLTMEDLRFALEGKFVTRVIYLEDPQNALPFKDDPYGQGWFEVGPGRDPLAVADDLGRPVAILRMGARLPTDGAAPDLDFLYGCPPLVKYVPSEQAPPSPFREENPQAPAPQKASADAVRQATYRPGR